MLVVADCKYISVLSFILSDALNISFSLDNSSAVRHISVPPLPIHRFSGLIFGGVSSGVSETASGLVDSLSEIADKAPGTPDETRDEPSGQQATDGEAKTIGEKEKKQEVTKEVAGLMSEYEFIPGVGFVLKSNVVST